MATADVFCQRLAVLRKAYPRYSNFFLDYEKITQAAASTTDSQALARLLQQELDKVNDIVDLEWEVIQNELKARLRKNVVEDRQWLDKLKEAVLALGVFVNANTTGFRRIIRQCEERQSGSMTWFINQVESAPFRQRNFDVALGQLGHLYALWRQKQPLDIYKAESTAEDVAAQSTSTFFIEPEKVLLAKAAILEHLRPDVPGAKAPTLGPLHWRRHSNQSASFDFKRQVTQVYFDNARGEQYAERRRRRVAVAAPSGSTAILESGGSASSAPFRCRWVGDNTGGPDFEVHVDVEGAPEIDVPLAQRDASRLASGALDQKAAASIHGHGLEQSQALVGVVKSVQDSSMRPIVSVSFSRSTFVGDAPSESSTPAEGVVATATMDEELSFKDEPQGSRGKAWCHAASSSTSGVSVEGFPGAILRLREGRDGSLAPLLKELTALGARPVPGFSKALHGTVLLHRKLAVPLPPWCPGDSSEASVDLTLAPPHDQPAVGSGALATVPAEAARSQAATSESVEPTSAEQPASSSSFLRRLCSQITKPFEDPAHELALRVDAKTPMANERTLLRWLRSAVMLSTLSAFLSSREELGARVNGLLLALLSLLFIFGPLAAFRQRSLEFADPKAKKPRPDYVLQQMLGWSLTLILASSLAVDWFSR